MAEPIHIPNNVSKTMSTSKVARTARQGMDQKQNRHKRVLEKKDRQKGKQSKKYMPKDMAQMGLKSDLKKGNRGKKNVAEAGANHKHLQGNIIDIHI